MKDRKQRALEKIHAKLKEARSLITECEELAKDHDVSFYFDVSYGMGGIFYPKDDDDGKSGWQASSHSC